MSSFKQRSLKTMSVLYRTLFVDKIDTVYIGDVKPPSASGKLDKEAIHEMRKAVAKPVSVFRSRPKLGGTGGFAAQVAQKHGQLKDSQPQSPLSNQPPPRAAPLQKAPGAAVTRSAADVPQARSIFSTGPSLNSLPTQNNPSNSQHMQLDRAVPAPRLAGARTKAMEADFHADLSAEGTDPNTTKYSEMRSKFSPKSPLPSLPLGLNAQDARASLPGLSYLLDNQQHEARNQETPTFPSSVDYRKAATRVRSTFAAAAPRAAMRLRGTLGADGAPVTEAVPVPSPHIDADAAANGEWLDEEEDSAWEEDAEDALDAFLPRIMCLDMGARSIGVAMSATDYRKAVPVTTLKTTVEVDDVDELQALLRDRRALDQTMTDREGRIYRRKTATELALELNDIRKEFNVIACVVGRPTPPPGKDDGLGRFIENFVGDMQRLNGLGKGFQVREASYVISFPFMTHETVTSFFTAFRDIFPPSQVLFWDEYGSTKRARRAMRALGMEVDRSVTWEQAKAAVAEVSRVTYHASRYFSLRRDACNVIIILATYNPPHHSRYCRAFPTILTRIHSLLVLHRENPLLISNISPRKVS